MDEYTGSGMVNGTAVAEVAATAAAAVECSISSQVEEGVRERERAPAGDGLV